MADVAKRIVGPVLLTTTTTTVLYTVPAATTTIVRNIHVFSTASANYTFSLCINGAVAANALYFNMYLPAGGAIDWSGFLVLAAGDTLVGSSNTATSSVITVSGIEAS